ncbi:MAG: potassium channel protein [Nitrospirota bacterium]|jgi:voltage-gated potassium channel
MSLRKRLAFSVFLIILVIASGTCGYVILEGWSVFDALYMTVITITTVGFKEVHELSPQGKLFTVVLVFFSVGAVFYALNFAARIIIEGEFKDVFGRKKLQSAIRKLRGHYIVCGYGRMGRIVCDELKRRGRPFVVIEKSPAFEPPEDLLLIAGDATQDEVLREAGIQNAAGLITVLPTDAENLYVVLSARGLAPTLNIVARAVGEGSEQKLLRAGANRAVSPYHIGGLRIAHMLIAPAMVDFIEFTTHGENIDIWMEEIPVAEDAQIAGQTLDQCGIGRELGVIIVAIKSRKGQLQINPASWSAIGPGDTLVALGEASKLKTLKEMAGKKEA